MTAPPEQQLDPHRPSTAERRRSIEHVARPRTAGAGLDVFAVEESAAQLVWSDLPSGPVELQVFGPGGAQAPVVVHHPGGPGVVELTGLDAGASHRVEVRSRRSRSGAALRRSFRTQPAPPGDELFRFATLNDLHIGREHRRSSAPSANPSGTGADEPTPREMAAAAFDDVLAWGAQQVIVKGDVCEESFEGNWDQAATVFGDAPVPVHLLPGNHDTGTKRHVEPEDAARARGLALTRGVAHLDVPGLRVVLADSCRDGSGWGTLRARSTEVADLAAQAHADGLGVFVATHHQPQRFTLPLYWPHGIPGPDARSFARTLRDTTPNALISSGHTHRCRVRSVGGVAWSEVAATNHFPATWAGYRVFAGGLMQVVRRTSGPAALAWSEHGRQALRGVWALWATGTISDRSFTLRWS